MPPPLLVFVMTASAVELDLKRCPGVEPSVVRSVLRASLREDVDPSLRLRVRCEGPEVMIRIEGLGLDELRRNARLASPSGAGRSRELGLLLAETAEAIQLRPPPEEDAPQAVATPVDEPEPESGSVSLGLGPSLWLDSDGSPSFGFGFGGSWSHGLLFVGAELSTHWGRSDDLLGQVQSLRVSGAVWSGVQHMTEAVSFGAGLGLRGGLLSASGEAEDPSSTDQAQEDFGFWGPMLTAHAEWRPGRHWSLQLRPEVGWAVSGAEATADGRRILDLRTFWIQAGLALQWRP